MVIGVSIGIDLKDYKGDRDLIDHLKLVLVDTPLIHGLDGSMQKIQILFPDPLMRRLRELAALEDRPLSEVIRRAAERFAEQSPCRATLKPDARQLPTFKGGRLLVESANMKQAIYSRDE